LRLRVQLFFGLCVNVIELILFWQSIKICNLCQICREQPTQTPWRGTPGSAGPNAAASA